VSHRSQPQDENEFRKYIYDKYREHFNHFYSLHQLVEAAMSNYRGFTANSYAVTLWLIAPRSFKSFDSIRRLCEVALCEDAAVILRSLLNLLAVTRWISTDPQKRAAKYLAWYWIAMRADVDSFREQVPPEWVETIDKKYDSARLQFEYKDANGNVRMPKKWHQPEANTLRDLFEQVGLAREYDDAYSPLSGIEHSDATAYFSMIAPMEKGDEKRLEIHSDFFVPHYLRNAFQYFADIFRICNQTLGIAEAKQFEKIVEDAIKFYKIDMQAKGITP